VENYLRSNRLSLPNTQVLKSARFDLRVWILRTHAGRTWLLSPTGGCSARSWVGWTSISDLFASGYPTRLGIMMRSISGASFFGLGRITGNTEHSGLKLPSIRRQGGQTSVLPTIHS
jgi:hypothetical protein